MTTGGLDVTFCEVSAKHVIVSICNFNSQITIS